MSDVIFRWWTTGGWSYNHGKRGAANNAGNPNPPTYGPPPITGANQLYGDGHVEWKDRSKFNPAAMEALDPSQPWVMGGGSVDATFY